MEFLKTYYFLIIMLTLASGGVFGWLFINREKLHAKWWEVLIVTLIHVVYGVLTVKFFALLEAGFDVAKAGNMSLFGGIFFMPLFYVAYALIKKLPFTLVFDIFTICLVGTLFFARINCLYAGCCIGMHIGDSAARWPTRGFELLYDAIFMTFTLPWIYKNKSLGRAYPIYMMSYGLTRFISEWFRESTSSSPFHIGHIWAIVSMVVGGGLFAFLQIRLQKQERKMA